LDDRRPVILPNQPRLPGDIASASAGCTGDPATRKRVGHGKGQDSAAKRKTVALDAMSLGSGASRSAVCAGEDASDPRLLREARATNSRGVAEGRARQTATDKSPPMLALILNYRPVLFSRIRQRNKGSAIRFHLATTSAG